MKRFITAIALVVGTQAHAFQESMDPAQELEADSVLEQLRFNGKEDDWNTYMSGFLRSVVFLLPEIKGIKEGDFLKEYIPSEYSKTLKRRVYAKSIKCHFQEVVKNGVNKFRVYNCNLVDNSFTKDIAP